MRIAICFSGMLRTGILTFNNIKRFIGDFWNKCDFFMHTWDISFQNPMFGQSWEHYDSNYKNRKINDFDRHIYTTLYNPKKFIIEPYWRTIDKIKDEFSKHIINNHPRWWWFPLFYSWGRSIEYKKDYELENNFIYDYCIKMRFDNIFADNIKLEDYINRISNNSFGINHIWKSDNEEYHADDIFFISNSSTMDHASTWWRYRIEAEEYKTDILPHVSFYNFLINNVKTIPLDLDIGYLNNDAPLAFYREECRMFDPLKDFEKCKECDKILYHGMKKSELKNITESDYFIFKNSVIKNRNFFPDKE